MTVRFSSEPKSYFVSTAIRQSGTHPAYHSRRNRASFLRDKAAQVKADRSPVFRATVKNAFGHNILVLPSCVFKANTETGPCLYHAGLEGVEDIFPAFQAELSGRIFGFAYLRRSNRNAVTNMTPPDDETDSQSLTISRATT